MFGNILVVILLLIIHATTIILTAPEYEQNTSTTKSAENREKNCIETLLRIKDQPFLSTDCCLTKICSNIYLQNKIVKIYPQLNELSFKLCSENFYLLKKEQMNGCRCFKNNLRVHVNNNTNITTVAWNKENPDIANCSVNFEPATINDGASQINSKITTDLERSSTKAYTTSFKSGLYIETSNSLTEDKKIRLENITEMSARSSGLQFLDIPMGDDMRIYDLRIDEEYLLFEAFSNLMGYLQPTGFPTDLLVSAIRNKTLPSHLLFQVLKLEIPAITWIVFWAIVSICLPVVIVVNLCCSSNIQRLEEDGSINFKDKCTENTLGFLLHVLLILLLCPLILILVGNEQISRSAAGASLVKGIIYEDINTFIRNTHMQISFLTTSSTDITIEAIRKDLEDVQNLLGIPYQMELSSEAGIDVILNILDELKISTTKASVFVSDILKDCESAQIAASLLQQQLREIARQLTVTRQQCNAKDRSLCYTLQYSGFDVMYATDNFTNDEKIKQLHLIGTEPTFNTSIENAHKTFSQLPDRIFHKTAHSISDIKTVLSRRRSEVYKSTHELDVLTRSLSETVSLSEETASFLIRKIIDWDMWRWLAVLGVVSALILIWGLLVCGVPCGCGLTSRTIPLLISGISLSSVMCLVVWSLGTVTFLLGGHGQSLLCQPLYDFPHYQDLAELLNSNGILYKNGFFSLFNKENDTLRIDEVLKDCQRDQPVYSTFHLHNQLDVNKVTNYKSWNDLQMLFSNLTISENTMEILSPSLQLNLQILTTVTNVNLSACREQISSPITKRDLNSFADQLNTVARQLSHPVSARKVDSLAFVVRKVINNEWKNLNEIRKRLIYKITALEVMLYPLNKQANQSLIDLKTVQFFLDNKGWQIADKATRKFIARIESNLEDLYNHVNLKVTKEIGKCRPLWEIFHTTRFYVCKLIVDPMNGIAFSSYFLILLFVITIPVVIKLVEYYRETNEDILSSISHRRTRDGLIIDDEGTWATPSSTPPDVPSTAVATISAAAVAPISEPQTWVSPRRPSEPLIPPPPRPPSNISSRIQSPRLPQIPSLSRARSPKSKLSTIASRLSSAGRITQIPSVSRTRSPRRSRGRNESLRLIEPICWKSGSTSPRSWL